MSRLLDPLLRGDMGGRAREAVLPLTAEAMSGKLLALYRSLIGPDRTDPAERTRLSGPD
jgi:hypothetical protein